MIEACSAAALPILLFFWAFCKCDALQMAVLWHPDATRRSFPGEKPVETSAPCGHMMVGNHHAPVVFGAFGFSAVGEVGGGLGSLPSGLIPWVSCVGANVTVARLKGQSVYI